MYWRFAIVNNKLGEIYYHKKKNGRVKILSHCYVKREDYKIKQEQRMIAQDIKRERVVYRNKEYKLIKLK